MAELTSTSVFLCPRWKLSSFLFRIKLTTSRDPGGNFWTLSLGWVSQSSIGNFFWTLDLSTYLKYSSIRITRNTFGFFMPSSHEKIRTRHDRFVNGAHRTRGKPCKSRRKFKLLLVINSKLKFDHQDFSFLTFRSWIFILTISKN